MEYQSASAQPPAPAAVDEFTHKDQSVTAMIFGIVSALLAWFPTLSIAAIVFGALAIKRSRTNKRFALERAMPENGMNVAGYATGLVGVIAGSVMTFLYLLVLIAIVLFAAGAGYMTQHFSGIPFPAF